RLGSGTSTTLLFFHAEDGIRGFHVTGVQTCALPISRASDLASSWDGTAGAAIALAGAATASSGGVAAATFRDRADSHRRTCNSRSEERRGGKGCATGRWP